MRDPLNQDASDRVLGLFGKLLEEEGCMGLVSWCVWTCVAKVFEY
jgi:hypothetical protein